MPPLHRYLGNPVLSTIGRIFFTSPIRDFHCGLRGFSRDAMMALELRAPGMEFASEMVVKATMRGLRITEVPTTLSPDGRSRPPHLRSWRDGWRHLRFLLIFCPRWLFLYPGAVLFVLGALGMAALLPGPVRLGGITLDVHSLLYASGAVVMGFQAMGGCCCSALGLGLSRSGNGARRNSARLPGAMSCAWRLLPSPPCCLACNWPLGRFSWRCLA
jgi:hypothetical protein